MAKSIPEVIKKVMPAVVSIAISKSVAALEKEVPPELLPLLPQEGGHLNIPEEMIDAHGMVKIGGGSGFIFSEDGIVITNKHVISEKDASYTVITNDDKKYEAKILARDPVDDVAILKIEAKGLPTVKLGNSTQIELGETVLAIGNALGLFKNTVSSGIISGLSRSIKAAPDPESPAQELRGLIQTDAAINPGNSGGPLVNLEGEAIGINTAIVFGAQNLGFTIPIDYAKRDLADIQKFGRIRRPLLGVRYVMLNDSLSKKMSLPIVKGAVVLGHYPYAPAIVPGSPADRAGIKEKDVIMECNGKEINDNYTIQDVLEEKNVGDIVNMKLMRGTEKVNAKVTLIERL